MASNVFELKVFVNHILQSIKSISNLVWWVVQCLQWWLPHLELSPSLFISTIPSPSLACLHDFLYCSSCSTAVVLTCS